MTAEEIDADTVYARLWESVGRHFARTRSAVLDPDDEVRRGIVASLLNVIATQYQLARSKGMDVESAITHADGFLGRLVTRQKGRMN